MKFNDYSKEIIRKYANIKLNFYFFFNTREIKIHFDFNFSF